MAALRAVFMREWKMKSVPRPMLLSVMAFLFLAACKDEIVGPTSGETIIVRVDVSGGIAAADYTFELQDDGSILGIRCANLCNFVPGDTLGRLTPAQRDAVKAVVVESGLPTSGRPANFGTQCCDQFTYHVVYTSGSVVRSFTGSSEALPDPLRRLVRTLHLAFLDTPPVILSLTTGLQSFSLDPLTLGGARVDGGILEVDVSYGGGCAQHDVDAVAYTGWMKSNPVQMGIALAHDDHDDLCDALVQKTLRFDLDHLRVAYTNAYGEENPTVVLLVKAGSGSPTGEIEVTYTW